MSASAALNFHQSSTPDGSARVSVCKVDLQTRRIKPGPKEKYAGLPTVHTLPRSNEERSSSTDFVPSHAEDVANVTTEHAYDAFSWPVEENTEIHQ